MNALLSIAPMIDWSYSHFRVFMRMLAPKALVYTEMQTVGAIKNKPEKTLYFNAVEHPISLQLGGSEPEALALCAKMAEQAGFDEINLNLGCPSDKVQAGKFGVCLMQDPLLVSRCITAMKNAVSIPVTAKIRLGIDHQDSYAFFSHFAVMLKESGVDGLIVHARKAWLNGLNPKQNRTIPPICYPYVYDLKKQLPDLPIIINGNIQDWISVKSRLQKVDGVMLGRLACDNPYAIAKIHHGIYPECPLRERIVLLQEYLNYAKEKHHEGEALSLLLKPVMNFAHGLPGASSWKQHLSRVISEKRASDFESVIELMPDVISA